MNRREFITLLSGMGAVYGLGARAQASEGPRRVGMLIGIANEPEGQVRVAAFKQNLARLGWVDGKNLQLDIRWSSGDPDRAKAHADELIGLAPDVLVGASSLVAVALQQRTRSIPIVFLVVPDPVRNGIVTNQARPDGNLTGFTNFEFSMGAKWLEILGEVAPGASRLGLMFDPAAISRGRQYVASIEDAARPLGIELENLMIGNAADVEHTIARFAREPDGGLIVLPDTATVCHRKLIVSSAAKHRLPAIYPYRYFATSGGLVSYGVDTVDLYARGAAYVDRILRGAKPADLPVQEPAKFELVINKTAAKNLGLDISPVLMAYANEIIG
jgi:putative ABC transport system substrate-binding protein